MADKFIKVVCQARFQVCGELNGETFDEAMEKGLIKYYGSRTTFSEKASELFEFDEDNMGKSFRNAEKVMMGVLKKNAGE